MSEVKRFDAFTSFDDFKSRMVESKDGNYVTYSDYLSQRQQTDALQTSLNNIINAFGVKGEGAYSKLVIEYVHGLVAENAAISDRLQKLIQIVNNADNSYCMCGDSMKNHAGGGCGSPTGMFDYHYNAWLLSEKETPNTDAFTAELRAQGAEHVAAVAKDIEEFDVAALAKSIADNLRAGRKCNIPPAGWSCTRAAGHDGPCAAVEDSYHE